MSVNHEAVAALPVTPGLSDAALIRAMCERRFAYCISASEVSTNLVAVDPATGVVPLYLLQNSTLFAYDSTDSTTVHDGVTCLVSSDGKRFKSGTISPPYSVLTKGTTAQPASPSVGNRYLIPTAATGTDWAGQDGKIGIYTAGGWRFAVSPIGRFLYIEDETAFYHRNAAGTWTAGVGSIALGAGSVTLPMVLGANASFVIKVENQTTNTPPGSPVTPTAYIIGPSPTGAWAGNAGKLAICLVTGSFTVISPVAGDTVYDKALNNTYRFDGTAWKSSAGAFVDTKTVVNSTYSIYDQIIPYDNTIPQISEGLQAVTTTFTPKSITNKLRVRFEVSMAADRACTITAAIFQDSISNALKAAAMSVSAAGLATKIIVTHEFVPATISSITLSARIGPNATANTYANGSASGRIFGGVDAAIMTIDEIPA